MRYLIERKEQVNGNTVDPQIERWIECSFIFNAEPKARHYARGLIKFHRAQAVRIVHVTKRKREVVKTIYAKKHNNHTNKNL